MSAGGGIAAASGDGILVIDKPRGWTSHDAVDSLRRGLGTARVGHAGTLDPLATGVLVCAVGRATRALRFLDILEKEYLATIRLGFETDSADGDGIPLSPESPGAGAVSRDRFEAALAAFRGPILQEPPAMSAVKVRGVPLHRRVRRGEAVSAPPRRVTVFALETAAFAPPTASLRLVTSPGTYVRAIVRDLGRALGVGAHVTALRRTRSGCYREADAIAARPGARPRGDAFDRALLEAALVPLGRALQHLPALTALGDEAAGIAHGRLAPRVRARLESGREGAVRLLSAEGELLAIAMVGAADAGTRHAVAVEDAAADAGAQGDASGTARVTLACVLARPRETVAESRSCGELSPCA